MKKFIFILLLFNSLTSFSNELISIKGCDNLGIPFSALENCAKKGDYFSQYNLGVMYRDGINVAKDSNKAFHWLTLSAKQGFDKAELNLGQLYELGIGTKINPQLAFEWTYKAATQGELTAVNNLGTYCLMGFGTQKNINRAIELYQLAAENGSAEAQLNLGTLYFSGYGIPKDVDKALFWVKQAAKQEHDQGMALLGVFYRELTQYSESLQWSRKAAEKGDGAAQNNVGRLLINRSNEEKQALNWFQKAADNNISEAMYALYQIYSKGTKDIPQDQEKANYWLEKAKQNGFVPPQ